MALLSGLNYFLENVSEPDHKLSTKCKLELCLPKEDLLSYYSDTGSNKYSKKGAQILLSRDNQISTSDLLSDSQVRTTPLEYKNVPNAIFFFKWGKHIDDNIEEANDTVISDANAKGSIYRFVAEDARSWKTMRATTHQKLAI
nr:BPK_HP1_G0043640.mRNA.1.CDS.1 [Saccharomyces cerevisiae]